MNYNPKKNVIKKSKTIFVIFLLFFISTSIADESIQKESSSSKTIKQAPISLIAPPYLQPGDLVFCEVWDYLVKWFRAFDVKSGFDHAALYYGRCNGIDWVIEATYLPEPKVRFTPLILLHLYSKVQFGKVINANETTRKNALEFAKSQIDQPYQHLHLLPQENPFRWHANFNPNDPIDPYSDWWYCAELVWASYYNQGIDLDVIYPEKRENNYVEGYGYLRFVSPSNIYNSTNTSIYHQ